MNKLSIVKRTQVISALIEGNAIRATVRMTGVSKKTVMRLLVEGMAPKVVRIGRLPKFSTSAVRLRLLLVFVHDIERRIKGPRADNN